MYLNFIDVLSLIFMLVTYYWITLRITVFLLLGEIKKLKDALRSWISSCLHPDDQMTRSRISSCVHPAEEMIRWSRSWISSCLHPIEEILRWRDPGSHHVHTFFMRDTQMTRSWISSLWEILRCIHSFFMRDTQMTRSWRLDLGSCHSDHIFYRM